MPITLPKHVARRIGVEEEIELVELREKLALADPIIDVLRSEEAQLHFLQDVQTAIPQEYFEIQTAVFNVKSWLSRKVELDGLICAQIIEIPNSFEDSGGAPSLPPTDAEKLLVRGWIANDSLLDEAGHFKRNTILIEWLSVIDEKARRIVRGICGVEQSTSSSSHNRTWTEASVIELRSESRILKHKEGELLRRLFEEAGTETIPRWRFLSLYRIIEHGYLDNIFYELSSRFFSEPKDALESASSAIKSEVEQFVRLVETQNLKVFFEEILKLNDVLVAANNQFAILIDREAKKKNYCDLFKRGVAICYQIRCAIVHAGSYSVIFDKTPGANDALLELLPEVEKSVVKLLDITIR